MEVNLDTLIEKIKVNGIEEADRKSKEMLTQTQVEAQEVIVKANNQAKQIIEEAQQESQIILKRGKDGLKQAQRDLLLSLEDELKDMCRKYISNISNQALSVNRLNDIIKTALSNWNFGENENIFIHLSSGDAQQITKESISGAVRAQGNTIEIKVDDSISKGFRISVGDENFAFDFTADAVSTALSVFLTPNVQELLR